MRICIVYWCSGRVSSPEDVGIKKDGVVEKPAFYRKGPMKMMRELSAIIMGFWFAEYTTTVSMTLDASVNLVELIQPSSKKGQWVGRP